MSKPPILIFLVLACIACSRKPEKTIPLSLKFERGDIFDIVYSKKASSQDDRININESARMIFKVDSVIGDSLFLLAARIGYVRVNNKRLFKYENYSSDKAEAEMDPDELKLHQEFKPILGTRFRMTINNKGKVVQPLTLENGKEIANEFSLIDFNYCLINFPAAPVAIGAKWVNEKPGPAGAGTRIATYKIESITDSVAQIGLENEMELPGSTKMLPSSGKYFFDLETGKFKSGTIAAEMETLLEGNVKFLITVEYN